MEKLKKLKIVLSDLHLSDGVFLPNGDRNPQESFHYDKHLIQLISFFSSNQYADIPVELILNGDVFDFLNIQYKNFQLEYSTERISLYKLKLMLKGHATVVEALYEFLQKKGKSITYIVGNHDADLFFSKVRQHLIEHVTKGEEELKEKFRVLYQPSYTVEGNVQIVHGHQSEPMHQFNYDSPLAKDHKGRKILKLPWGSLFVMNVVYKFKKDRSHIDKIHPISLYLLFNLFADPVFTIKISLYTVMYYIKTRFNLLMIRQNPIKELFSKINQLIRHVPLDFKILDDGEAAGRAILKSNPEIEAVIMGHTHLAKEVLYPDGRVYINTGTWIKSISLSLTHFGRLAKQPFCKIEYFEDKEKPEVSLHEWIGYRGGPYRPFID